MNFRQKTNLKSNMLAAVIVALSTRVAYAEEIQFQEFKTEVQFSAVPIEEDASDDMIATSQILERELEVVSFEEAVLEQKPKREIVTVERPKNVVAPMKTLATNPVLQSADGERIVGVFTENVPSEILEKSRRNFRNLFGDAVVQTEYADPRFVGSLKKGNEAGQSIFSEESLFDEMIDEGREVAETEALSPEKAYTVQNGKIVEIAAVDIAPAKKPPTLLKGEGWMVSAVDEKTSAIITPVNPHSAANSIPTNGLLNSSAAQEATPESKFSEFRGHVTLPKGISPSSVVVRIAGTGWHVTPDAEGYFEFQDVPRGSRFKLVFFDVDGSLSRRIIPVSASEAQNEVEVELVRTSEVDVVAGAFGVQQAAKNSGFCGQLTAGTSAAVVGAKVKIVSSEAQGPFFYDIKHFPNSELKEATTDGRFCFFNNASRSASVQVQLLNGARRTFHVNLEASVFEPNLEFNVDATVYRPVHGFEMLDSQTVMGSTEKKEELSLGIGAGHTWIKGEDSPIWTRVSEFHLLTDNAYASKFIMGEAKNALQYIPLSDEYAEVGWRSTSAGPRAFELFSKSEIAKKQLPLSLHLIDPEATVELDAVASSEGIDRDLGVTFVNLNVAALGLEYNDVKMYLKNPWTGETVSKFQFIPLAEGVRTPRYIRGFFANLPEGDYSLVISNADGVLKWLDVVRSRAGELQVLSIKD